jgi:glycosyltransferase involved in cell wall biosynthesis
MLSVIICSVNPVALATVKKNIEETIGVPHEVIAIDNGKNQYGICKAYNEGARKATYPFLCFMHEDISFETANWGQMVCAHLADERTGLLGVAGGDAKSAVPSSWSIPVVSNEINLVQHYKRNKAHTERILVTNPHTTGVKKQVAALDGVWLCTRRSVFEQFAFDETTFTGFHGYDIDYSLQVGTRYNLYVVFDIVIHHFSEGNPDKRWIDSALLISKKWKNRLPVSIHPLTASEYNWHHWHSMQVFIQHLFRLEYSYVTIIRSYLAWSFTRFFTFRRFLSMGKYVVTGMFSTRTK